MEENQNKLQQEQIQKTVALTSNERNISLTAHLAFLGGLIVPFCGVVAPLIIWQMHKDKSAFITRHAIEALNANITILIALILSGVLFAVLIGFVLLPIVIVMGLVFFIQGAIAASDGKDFCYPMIVRFIKS